MQPKIITIMIIIPLFACSYLRLPALVNVLYALNQFEPLKLTVLNLAKANGA